MSDESTPLVTVESSNNSTYIDSDQLAGYFYLSSITSDDIAQKAYDLVLSKLRYMPDSFKQWFDWYTSYYKTYDSFPTWEKFLSASAMSTEITYDFKQAGDLFNAQLTTWESDFLATQMVKLPLTERRELMQRMSKVLENDVEVDDTINSNQEVKVDDFVLEEQESKALFKFPIQRLNTQCIINEGQLITVMAPPGMFKSQFALNLLYLNCYKGPMNGLHIYLENKEEAYQAELLSRYSFDNGMRIENTSLKRKVLKEDKSAIDRLESLVADYHKNMQGKIYLVPFSKFNPEPIRFANQLAKYVAKYDIGLVTFDYLQAAKSFTPLKWDRREFLNELCSSFRTCCLGMFGCKPFVGVMLAQPKREAEERMLKTQGSGMTAYDGAEVSSLERDAFVSLGLFASAEMKSANTLSYKILKNRDEAMDINTTQTTVIPQFCFIGDESESSAGSSDIFSMDSMDSGFDFDFDL